MKRKRALILLICMCIVCIFAGLLAACGGGEQDYTSNAAPNADGHYGVEVVFELEGGTYQNSTRHVRMYFYIPEGGETLISPPGENSERELNRANYHITGWFKNRHENSDGTVTYSDAWDFERDTVKSGDESLTLYCGWAVNVRHTYDISYYDENGEVKTAASIQVQAGDTFSDPTNQADARVGYTARREATENGSYAVCYYSGKDESGNWIPWDPAFTHPGGETSTAVQVFVDYLKGDFVYVTSASELISASKSYARTGNGVYLTKDIDLGGEEIAGFRNNAGVFAGVFYGNGYKISNFVLTCSATNDDLLSGYHDLDDFALCIGFFGILDGATVENLTIEGMTLNISIANSKAMNVYIAPLAALAVDSTVTNVHVSAEFTVTRLERYKGEAHIVTDRPVWDETFVGEDCDASVTLTDNRTE